MAQNLPSRGTLLDVGSLRRGGSPTTPVGQPRGDGRLRMLLDGAVDYAIVMLGPQGMVLTWSAGAERILGHTGSQIIGQDWSLFFHDGTRPDGAAAQALQHAARSGRFEEQGWLLRRDGERVWAEVVLTVLDDRDGRARGYCLVARDLSERLRGLELLAVLDAASDAILAVDAAGRLMFLNTAAERAFGYCRDELLGQPLERLLPERPPERPPAEATTPGCPPAGPEAVRKDGSRFPAQVVLATVPTPWGRITTATVRDLSAA